MDLCLFDLKVKSRAFCTWQAAVRPSGSTYGVDERDEHRTVLCSQWTRTELELNMPVLEFCLRAFTNRSGRGDFALEAASQLGKQI